MVWRAIAAAFVVLLAGCSGGALSERPETVTPAPVPDPAVGAAAVPGLTNDSVVSTDALARAHRNALANQSYNLTVRWETSAGAGRTRLDVEGERRYYYRSEQMDGAYSDRTFVDGTDRYDRHRRPLGVKYVHGQSVAARDRFGHLTGRLLRSFLPTGPARITPHPLGYELAVGRPPTGFERTDAYTARAVVGPEGFVYAFAVTYRNTAQNTTVHHRFRYTEVGTTTVERPAWVDERWPERRETATAATYDSS